MLHVSLFTSLVLFPLLEPAIKLVTPVQEEKTFELLAALSAAGEVFIPSKTSKAESEAAQTEPEEINENVSHYSIPTAYHYTPSPIKIPTPEGIHLI